MDNSEKDKGSGRGRAVFDAAAAGEAMGLTVEEFAPLLPKAAAEIRLRMDAIRRGVTDGDLRAVSLNSHTVKSITATLGAEDVNRAARDLEMCAKDGDRVRCADLLAGLEGCVAALLAELDAA